MADNVGPGRWEEVLDRELALASEPDRSSEATHPNSERPTSPSTDNRPDRQDRSISLGQLRRRIFDSLQSGMTLQEDIYDESGVLLLAAGSLITQRFLELLRERGITQVRLRPVYMRRPSTRVGELRSLPIEDGLHTPRSRKLDERMAEELQKTVVFRPVKAWRRPRIATDDLKEEANRGVEKHTATSVAVVDLCESLQAGHRMSAAGLRKSVARFVDMAAIDFDLLPLIVAIQQSKDEYLYDHCVNVALLSMAIATQLGMHYEEITQIGLAGLLHDIGMLRVPPSIRLARKPLTGQDWREIRRHPLHTLDMLAGVRGIPQTVNFVAYQAHERLDGRGYPRGRSGREIHKYTEIVSIADVYAAMTRARPYRFPLSPYVATRTILTEGAGSEFDRELVRALLNTVSLFPIGSRVELNTGSIARVLRANPSLHTRPVVEELTADGYPTGHIIDLSNDDAARVVRAS